MRLVKKTLPIELIIAIMGGISLFVGFLIFLAPGASKPGRKLSFEEDKKESDELENMDKIGFGIGDRGGNVDENEDSLSMEYRKGVNIESSKVNGSISNQTNKERVIGYDNQSKISEKEKLTVK